MSVFDGGALRVVKDSAGAVLRYDLISRALLFCFLAPLLFLAIGQFTVVVAKFDKPPQEAAKKHTPPPAMNPVDKFLHAPAADASKKGKDDEDGGGKKGKKLSPTSAYVFAGIFAALYLVGRVLEDRLAHSLFRKTLLGDMALATSSP